MGQIHDRCQLPQSSVRISQPPLGEARERRRTEGGLSRVHCVLTPPADIPKLIVADAPRLLQLALVQWEEHFFLYIQSMHAKLTSAILRSIECERNGETI